MNPIYQRQFWIALACGLVAFFLGAMDHKKPKVAKYLVLKQDVQVGDTITANDFEQLEIRADLVPSQVFDAEDLEDLEGAYYRRPERAGSLVLTDLVIKPSESYALDLQPDETPVRIPLPASMSPTDFVIGSRVNILIRRELQDDSAASLELRNYRIVSVGKATSQYEEDQWVDKVTDQDFVRIAVNHQDEHRPKIEAASDNRGGYRVVDVYARKN